MNKSTKRPPSSKPISFELGERVLIPALLPVPEPRPGEPATRPLWVYASDPASFGLRQPTVKLEVPYELVKPGPAGALFKVSAEKLPRDLTERLDWSEDKVETFTKQPLDLEERLMLLQGGLLPTTGDPRFAGQMVYAVCQQVWRVFASALGRNPVWGPWVLRRPPDDRQLLIKPFSLNESNAFYDGVEGSIGFGYFEAYPTSSEFVLPGGTVFVALSRDVIAHEMTHALLDGMRAEFMRDTHPDVPAFHEAFADIVALLHNFAQEDLVQQALEDSGKLDGQALLGIGRQIGEATNGGAGGAMRVALRAEEPRSGPLPEDRTYREDHSTLDEHGRGSILVAAVFEALLAAFEARAKPLLRLARIGEMGKSGVLPTELTQLLAKEVRKLAHQFLNITVRAIDYCPPVDVRFGEYLRAMLTADFEVVPNDGYGYRDKLIKAFRRRNIKIENVLDLSQESLRWGKPDADAKPIEGLRFRDLRFEDDSLRQASEEEIRRRAEVLGAFVTRDRGQLSRYGLHEPGGAYGPIVVQSLRLLYRVDASGFGRNDLIAEVTQTRASDSGEFVGGATLIVGPDGRLRYTVRKRVDDDQRCAREREYTRGGGAAKLDLRRLHRLPSRNGGNHGKANTSGGVMQDQNDESTDSAELRDAIDRAEQKSKSDKDFVRALLQEVHGGPGPRKMLRGGRTVIPIIPESTTVKSFKVFEDPRYLKNARALAMRSRGRLRVIGGARVPASQFLDCVAVGNDHQWGCTGTLIAPKVVLTAGHCADFATRIFVGSDVTQLGAGKVVKVKRRVRHPQYHQGKHNDLMVLILEEKVEGVAPRKFARKTKIDGATDGRVMGFGNTDATGDYGYGQKRFVDVPVASPDCRGNVGSEDDNVTYGCDVGLELVAGRPLLARDSCTGDSGGPFYVQDGEQWLLAAATSRATDSSMSNCGDGGVYVRADRYRSWIDSIPGVTLP